ncbi:hypothetical protein [Paenibacillus sp. Z6-24]
MMESMEEDFNQFKAMRMERAGRHLMLNSEEYKRLVRESDRFFTELCTYVKSEGMQLLMDYCKTVTLLQGAAESLMYESGLNDGMLLSNKLLFSS